MTERSATLQKLSDADLAAAIARGKKRLAMLHEGNFADMRVAFLDYDYDGSEAILDRNFKEIVALEVAIAHAQREEDYRKLHHKEIP